MACLLQWKNERLLVREGKGTLEFVPWSFFFLPLPMNVMTKYLELFLLLEYTILQKLCLLMVLSSWSVYSFWDDLDLSFIVKCTYTEQQRWILKILFSKSRAGSLYSYSRIQHMAGFFSLFLFSVFVWLVFVGFMHSDTCKLIHTRIS